MANPARDAIKKRMKKQIDATEEKAAIFSGEKDKIGKYKTKEGKKSEPKEADLDKFFRQVEEGFTDLKQVKKYDKHPYDGKLGNVQVERLVKTTND